MAAVSTQRTKTHMRLDDFLPVYQFNHVHVSIVDAPASTIYQTIREMKPADLPPLVHLLFALRAVPAWLQRKPGHLAVEHTPIIEQGIGAGFVLLDEIPCREIVLGAIGRFWTFGGDIEIMPDDEQHFRTFDDPRYARAAMNFYLNDRGARGVEVYTETRVYAPTKRVRRLFDRYWWFIAPGSALIRALWLRTIKAKAEQQ
jgi:hypothetical protein